MVQFVPQLYIFYIGDYQLRLQFGQMFSPVYTLLGLLLIERKGNVVTVEHKI